MAERDQNRWHNLRPASASRHRRLHNAAWCGDGATESSISQVSKYPRNNLECVHRSARHYKVYSQLLSCFSTLYFNHTPIHYIFIIPPYTIFLSYPCTRYFYHSCVHYIFSIPSVGTLYFYHTPVHYTHTPRRSPRPAH